MADSVPLIKDEKKFADVQRTYASFQVVLFYNDTSERSREAFRLLEQIKRKSPDTPLVAVNVSAVRTIHPRYGVTTVPTVITIKKGAVVKKLEGLQAPATYRALISGAPRRRADGSEAPPLRVVVYSSPTCPPCGTVKAHLRKKGVPFRVVDISADEHAARAIVSRTGQSAVPQTDINGTVVVGADIARIDRLLAG